VLVVPEVEKARARDGGKGRGCGLIRRPLEFQRADEIDAGFGLAPARNEREKPLGIAGHVREKPVGLAHVLGIEAEAAAPAALYVGKAGHGRVVVQVGDVIDYQTSAIFFAPDFVKDPDLAARFLAAYIKSCRYYFDATLVKKDGKLAPGANYDEVVGIIAKYTGAPAADIKLGLPYMDRDGKLLASDIQTQIDWYFSQKMIEKKVSASQVIDAKIFEEALKKVGAAK